MMDNVVTVRFRFLNPGGPALTVPALQIAVETAIKKASGDNVEIVSYELRTEPSG